MVRMAAAQKHPLDWEPSLVQRARDGDVGAFERLYRQNVGRVYALCLRLTRNSATAEDCTQEAFIKAWRSLGRFEVRSAFGTWLHRIAVNVVLSRRRASAAWVDGTADPMAEVTEAAEPDWTLDTVVEVEEIELAIGELPEGARDVLVLSGIYGYSHEETAQMLGVAEGTCKAQLHRARVLLRRRLQPEASL
jgi:RNA polymerase sigma-70 factor, ECF subfamily